jgi:TRAP-type uncharacterized transport system fused permease subunit
MSIGTALLGVFLLGTGSIGFYKTSMPLWLRGIALIGALSLLIPGIVTDSIGLAVLIAIHLIQTAKFRKNPGVFPA